MASVDPEKPKDVESNGKISSPGSGREVDFGKVDLQEAFSLLNATSDGLTEDQARDRLAEYGPNKLPESTVNPVMRFLGYLWNPLSWAMEVAALLAIALNDFPDFALIVALLLLNAAIAFVEESNADKAIKALTSTLAPKCRALRGGKVEVIDAVGLVPGDVIIIRLGDVLPADVKIMGEEGGHEEVPMQIDQAALTGESLPVKKFKGDVAFSGSTVKQGERHALVYATGSNTFFGKAASLISTTNNTSNIQKIMTRIGAVCLVTIGLWIVIELGVQFGAHKHKCYGGAGGCPTLSNLLVIIVGGIPIAMPTVLSVTLALGAFQLAKSGAIVARMSAVEEMAGMDVLCSDKTGTLTLNQLTIEMEALQPMPGFDKDALLKYAALSANTVTQEAIDVVLFESHPQHATIWEGYKLLRFVPFNPVDKFTMAVIQEEATGEVMRLMKGAPQVVVRRAYNRAEVEGLADKKISEFASRGLRALGIGIARGDGAADDGGTKWEFVGLVPLFDPPRHDTKDTIEQCLEKGISVKMITGDQQLIGIETAKRLGMGTNIFKVETLLEAKAGGGLVEGHASVEELVESAHGFAEVYPEHKYEIVKILQDGNHMVGMTGDGVNDAPALKKADVGIAVSGATDAARGAADIVLTEAGLSAIVHAVIGAREIFQRMTTYAKYTVAMTFRICFTFGILTVAYNWYFPTILIVLLAVFNDGAMIALSKDRVRPSPTPNTWTLTNIFIMGLVYGLYLTVSTWTLYHVAATTTFFEESINMFSLTTTPETLEPFCNRLIRQSGHSPSGPANVLYPGVQKAVTLMQQCIVEQQYVRGAQLRSLMYAQVSISGQALVFVTRTSGHSMADPAGLLTYVAFFAAQIASSLIAAFGFGGYAPPRGSIGPCQLCLNSKGDFPDFFASRVVPVADTEGRFTASVIGCSYWIVVAWIWSLIWYVALDPIKWFMAWVLNEEGVRSRKAYQTYLHNKFKGVIKRDGIGGMVPPTYDNPLGRCSLAAVPKPDMLARASMVMVEKDQHGLERITRETMPPKPHKHYGTHRL